VTVSDVVDHLLERGDAFTVLPHAAAVTPAETARVHGIDANDLVRTEVMTGAAGTCLMVVPDLRYLDLDLARKALGDASARQATHVEIRTLAPTCDIGAVPPLPLFLMVPMYLDPAVARATRLTFPAGRAGVLVVIPRAALYRDDPYVIAPLTRESVIDEGLIAPARRKVLDGESLLPAHLQPADDRPVDVA
jgi:prolyl-tRNA editing enzyme YbaK/EbsC (Cys-tRNA(Pro) deacylase)